MTVNDKINEVIAVITHMFELMPYSVIPREDQDYIVEWLADLKEEEV